MSANAHDSVYMRRGSRAWSLIVAAKEALGLEILPYFRRRTGVQALHFFDLLGSQLRQPPDEMDQMPAGLLAFRRPSAPRGHSCQADPILDDVEQLTIRKRLRRSLAHIRRLGIETETNPRLSTSIVRVTCRAMIRVMSPTSGDHFSRCRDRILPVAIVPWNSEPPHRPRHCGFDTAWLGAGADAPRTNPDEDQHGDNRGDCNEQHKGFQHGLHRALLFIYASGSFKNSSRSAAEQK